MKINQLQENLTPASTPSVKTIPPKFGRSDEMLESDCGTTGAGSVASVSQPVGKMQRRGKGSMLKGIKTSAKYPNSAAVKEGRYGSRDAYQRDYDSSITGFGRRPREDDEFEPEYDDKMRRQTGMIFYNIPNTDEAYEEAQLMGMKRTRAGKWFLPVSVGRLTQQRADRMFGQGKVWYPKNESVNEEQLDEIFNPTSSIANFLRAASSIASDYIPVAVGAATAFTATSALLGPVAAMLASSTVGTQILQTMQNQQNKVPGIVQQLVEKYFGSEQEKIEFALIHAKAAFLGETEFRWRGKQWLVTLEKNAAEAIVEKNDKYWLEQQLNQQKQSQEQPAMAEGNKFLQQHGHGGKFPEPRKPRPDGMMSKSEVLGKDGLVYHWQDPRGKQGVGEAKKANTKTARAEFGKRVKAKPSEKEQEQKKSESDAAWERLMAYAAAEKEKKVDEASPETTFNVLKGLKTWQVVIFNNYYAGKYSDYRGRYYYVLAHNPDEAKQVVLDNADGILQDILSMKSHNGKRILPPSKAVPITSGRIGKIEDGTVAGRMSTAGFKTMFGPQGPMMVKLSGGAVVDIQSEEQVNEKSKSQAQFRTMAAVAHNPKFAKKVGISQKVGKEFHNADRKQNYKDLPKEVEEGSPLNRVRDELGDQGYIGTQADRLRDRERQREYMDRLHQSRMHQQDRHQRSDDAYTDSRVSYWNSQADKYKNQNNTDGSYKPERDPMIDKAMNMFIDRMNRHQYKSQRDVDPEQLKKITDIKYKDEVDEGNAFLQHGFSGKFPEPRKPRPDGIMSKSEVLGKDGLVYHWQDPRGRQDVGQAETAAQSGINGSAKCKVCGTAYSKHFRFDDQGKPVSSLLRHPTMISRDFPDLNTPAQQAAIAIAKKKKQGINEFAPDDSGDNGEEDTLRKFAKMWYNGDDNTQQQIEKLLARGGWEIGELESEEGGAFVVQAGDENGDSYIGFTADDLTGLDEEKQRLDPKCWTGYKKQGTKMKGDTRVNNCVKVDEAEVSEDKLAHDLYKDFQIFKKGADKDIGGKAKDKEIGNKPKDKDIIAKEDWQKVNKSDKTDGMSDKAVKAYRRENPGSKLKTAVTKKPSELKAGSKDAKRRKSFCARMSGVKGPMKDEKGRPTAKAKALKRWNC